MHLFKNEKIRKIIITVCSILIMATVSIPVFAIQQMTDKEKAYFLTNDELYWFIGTNFDLLYDYVRK